MVLHVTTARRGCLGCWGLVNLMDDLYLHVSVESGDTRFSPQINQADLCSVPLGFLQLVLSLLKSMAHHHQTLVGYESGAAQPVAGLHVPRRWHTDCPDRLLGRRQAVTYNRCSATLLNTCLTGILVGHLGSNVAGACALQAASTVCKPC